MEVTKASGAFDMDLARTGADFATLAMRHSEDASRREGGLLPPFGEDAWIESDLRLGSGNSGGPMFNVKGEIIGIVSHMKALGPDSWGLATAITMVATAPGTPNGLTNGRAMSPIVRGYSPTVEPTGPISFGRVPLRAGVNTLTFEIIGKDAERTQGYYSELPCPTSEAAAKSMDLEPPWRRPRGSFR